MLFSWVVSNNQRCRLDNDTGEIDSTDPATQMPENSNVSAKKQPLSHLPVELVELICNQMAPEDVLNLAIAIPSSRNIAIRHIHKTYMAIMGEWAGQSIICIGDCAGEELKDYPPGMFIEEEWHELSKHKDSEGRTQNLYDWPYLENNPLQFRALVSDPTDRLASKLQSQLLSYFSETQMVLPKSKQDFTWQEYKRVKAALEPRLSKV